MKQETRRLVRIGVMIVCVWLVINYWAVSMKLLFSILGAALPPASTIFCMLMRRVSHEKTLSEKG